ncbi:MAG: leucine-rich repeat protein [Lentimicrobiaceae bacterium]|nr:leucine-rich repeat protein [Lentimicrobiaceae bacterium]
MKKVVNFLAAFAFIGLSGSANAQITVIDSGTTDSLAWILTSDSVLTISGDNTMPNYFHHNPPWYTYRNAITTIVIDSGVTSIGGAAFAFCENLKSVIIPNSVTSIGFWAFYTCSNLTFVTIPNSVISIDWATFGGCSNLTSVIIGNSVASIGEYAFNGCSDLKSIVIYATTPPVLANAAFYGMPIDVLIFIPCGTLNSYSNDVGWSYFSNFIEQSDRTFYSASICQGGTYSDANFSNLTRTGTYYVTLANSTNCDSIVCLTLTEYPYVPITQISDSIRIGDTCHFNGKLLTEEGVYYDTLQTIFGCDSIIELTLKISNVGIINYELGSMNYIVYPNPTTGKITVESYKVYKVESVEVYDVVGRKYNVGAKHVLPDDEIVIDISHLANGLYFLKIDGKMVKIAKQ